jgi:tetratricopeptide (TPR) repeat protein
MDGCSSSRGPLGQEYGGLADELARVQVKQVLEAEPVNFDLLTKWLNRDGNCEWILVVDDVDPLALQPNELSIEDREKPLLIRFLDSLEQGTVVLATQRPGTMALHQGLSSIKVHCFEESESLQLLQDRLGYSSGGDTEDETSHPKVLNNHPLVQAVVTELCDQLGHNPLALSVAASTIQSDRQLNVSRYLDQLKRSVPPNDLPKEERELFATMKLSFSRLVPSAQSLLRICAHFDPRRIWADLLDHAEDPDLIEHLGNEPGMLSEAIQNLEEFSLFVATNKFSTSERPRHALHSAMHRFLRYDGRQQSYQVQQLFFTAAVTMLGRSIPERQTHAYVRIARSLQGHAELCHADFLELKVKPIISPQCYSSLGRIARVLECLGQVNKAVESLGTIISMFPPSGTITEQMEIERIDMVNSRGVLLLDQGRLKAAKEHFEEVIASEAWSQPQDDDSLESQVAVRFNLSIVCRVGRPHDYRAARDYIDEAMVIMRQLEARSPRKLLFYRLTQCLGVLHGCQGRYEEAFDALSDALDGFRTYYNCDSLHNAQPHVYIAWALEDLGTICCKRREFDMAKKHFQEAREIMRDLNIGGSRLDLRIAWQEVLLLEARFQDATAGRIVTRELLSREFQTLLDAQIAMLGAKDPQTLRTCWRYGNHLRRTRQPEDEPGLAREKLTEAIRNYRRMGLVDDTMHQTDMYEAIASLGKLYASTERSSLALDLCQEALYFFAKCKDYDDSARESAIDLTSYIAVVRNDGTMRHSENIRLALFTYEDGTLEQREAALATVLDYQNGTLEDREHALVTLLAYNLEQIHERRAKEELGAVQRLLARRRSWTAWIAGALRALLPWPA